MRFIPCLTLLTVKEEDCALATVWMVLVDAPSTAGSCALASQHDIDQTIDDIIEYRSNGISNIVRYAPFWKYFKTDSITTLD